jgi:polyisoprenoid-binding protein YceI
LSLRTRTKWIIVAAVAVVALAGPVGAFAYIHFIQDKAPPPLSQSTSTVAAGGPLATSIDGTWKPTAASVVGYRVKEVLFGQSTEAVGRTSSVTGALSANGTTISSASFTVDMTTVASDKGQRDSQFRSRIMDVARFPTATFTLTQPVALAAVPTETGTTAEATGELTLHGVTKAVQLDLTVKRAGSSFTVGGSLAIVFADWRVPNPSFGPAQTEDHGILEFALVLAR